MELVRVLTASNFSTATAKGTWMCALPASAVGVRKCRPARVAGLSSMRRGVATASL